MLIWGGRKKKRLSNRPKECDRVKESRSRDTFIWAAIEKREQIAIYSFFGLMFLNLLKRTEAINLLVLTLFLVEKFNHGTLPNLSKNSPSNSTGYQTL